MVRDLKLAKNKAAQEVIDRLAKLKSQSKKIKKDTRIGNGANLTK